MSNNVESIGMIIRITLLLFAILLCAVSSSDCGPVPQPQQLGSNGRRFTRLEGYGDTNIPCNRPGSFARAPDGCNRCYCELDGKFSSVCSRALCPSSAGLFPSFGGGQRAIVF